MLRSPRINAGVNQEINFLRRGFVGRWRGGCERWQQNKVDRGARVQRHGRADQFTEYFGIGIDQGGRADDRRYFSLETMRELTHPEVLLEDLGPLRLAPIH
ncbi:MAG TPA: hypothetical protein VMW34_10450 [Anaerolineales bacterium]|nr:hypothetical protein [Anaerolineales bacterium]